MVHSLGNHLTRVGGSAILIKKPSRERNMSVGLKLMNLAGQSDGLADGVPECWGQHI
jgi:hypothetical protein